MKRILISFACICFFPSPAHAILDENGNGMSDVWEKQHNAGKLLTWDFLPWADADADGMDNEMESIAGTNPFSHAGTGGLFRVSVGHTPAGDTNPATIDVTHPTALGKNYRLISSPDLKNWTPLDAAYLPGTGLETTWHFPIAGNPRYFFKPEISDEDPDGDGLTTAEELSLGTDPTNAFTHGGTTNDLDSQTAVTTQTLVTAPDSAADADGDGTPDVLDADSEDGAIHWLRIPESDYLALEVPALPTDAVPIDLGAGGHVLAISPNPGDIDWWWEQWPGEHPTPANGSTHIWKPGATGWGTELPELPYRIPIGFSITPDGTVLGNACQALVDENGNPRGGPGNVIVPGQWPLAGNGGYEAFSMDWSGDDFGETGFAAEGGGLNVPIIGGPEKLLPLSFGPQVFTYDYTESTTNLKLAEGTVLETFDGNSGPSTRSIEAAGGSSGWFAYRIVVPDENGTITRQTVDPGGGKHPGPAESGGLVSFASIDPFFVPQPPGTPLPAKPDVLLWSSAGQTHIGTHESTAISWQASTRPAADRLSGKVNARGEGVKMRSWTENGPEIASLWRNGTWRKLSDYLPSSYTDLKIIDINDAGLILLTADQQAIPANGTTPAQPARNDQPLLLAPAALRLDANRDGMIDGRDEAAPIAVTPENPWHWWINDDDDVGDICSSNGDVPGIHGPSTFYNPYTGITTSSPDRNDSHDTVVNSRGDIVDFFPVHLDLKTVLNLMPEGGFTVKLKHTGGALNFVYTDLELVHAGDFLKKEGTEGSINHDTYGPAFNQAVRYATTERITAAGVELNAAFLKKIRDSGKTETQGEGENQTTITNPEKGVILLEGRDATTAPLVVEISKGSEVIGRIELPLILSGVEDMYRWVNLRPVVTGQATSYYPTRSGEPENYPDHLTSGKTLVFLHGYNVSREGSRGTCAEVFKRFHQSGSKAKFTGVSWQGNESQGAIPIMPDTTPDYHQNVVNAFETSPEFAKTLATLPGEKHVMAHSLGNMVAASAIKDHSAQVAQYYAVDAAIAKEAFDAALETNAEGVPEANLMREQDWIPYEDSSRPGNPRRTWASEWYKLYADDRHKATWRGRFGNIENMWNFYSSGEEVLAKPTTTATPDIGAKLAWVSQEKLKGTYIGLIATFDGQGGWGFNQHYYVGLPIHPRTHRNYNPEEASWLSDDDLRGNPFFEPLEPSSKLHTPASKPCQMSYMLRAKVLAKGIPALTFAMGGAPLGIYDPTDPTDPTQISRNIDMMGYRPPVPGVSETNPDGSPNPEAFQWPVLPDPEQAGNWRHSDFRDVAFYYTWRFYEKIVDLGELKQ